MPGILCAVMHNPEHDKCTLVHNTQSIQK